MKALQSVELDIFKAFAEVCEKLNIRYYLLAGTMLGAVRHKGFIPWDDDIDVGIVREDYDRFLKEAPALLPDYLFVQTYESDPEYPHIFAKIRNSNTTFIETPVRDNTINHGIYIDVFPLDRCYANTRNKISFRLQEQLLSLRISKMYKNASPSLKVKFCRAFTTLLWPKEGRALQRLDRLYRSMPKGDCLVNFSGVYGEREIMPADWYGEGVKLDFEGIKVTVPQAYDKWLSQVYGDYMQLPPVEKRVSHHDTTAIDTHQSFSQYLK